MPLPSAKSSYSGRENKSAEAIQANMERIMAIAGHDIKQPLQLAVMSIERAIQGTSDAKVASRHHSL